MIYRARFLSSRLAPVKSANFPYEFRRTRSLITDNTEQREKQDFLLNCFGSDTFNGFAFAYKNTIEALNESDMGFLKDNLEANLLKGISIPATQLVNPDSPVDCKILDMSIDTGVKFDRASNQGLGGPTVPSMPIKWLKFQLYMPTSNFSIKQLSVIFRATIEFTTAYKLIQANTP